MPVDWAIKIVLGIVLIFGSTSFVTWISGAVS
jgi:type IV secretory pathway VirB2 component (pilin)